jgi:hypothetical protein
MVPGSVLDAADGGAGNLEDVPDRVREGAAGGAGRSAPAKLAGQRALEAVIRRLPGQHRRTAHLTRRQVPAGMREAGTCPGPSPPGRYAAGPASRTHDHIKRCHASGSGPGCGTGSGSGSGGGTGRGSGRGSSGGGGTGGHWRRLHRLGPRRLRLRRFRLRCLTSIRSRVWHHLARPFAVGHRGLTGTICGHPEMIPSRPFAHHSAADLLVVLCAYLRMPYEPDPGDLSHAGGTARWRPDRTDVPIVS